MDCNKIHHILVYKMLYNPLVELGAIGYGADSDKNPYPRIWDVYVAINTRKVYYCKTDGIWTEYTCEGASMIPAETIEQPGSINAVPADTPMTVVSYTNNGGVLRLTGFYGSGDIEGEWELLINGVVKGTVRTSHQDRTAKIVLPNGGSKVANGSIVSVRVTHWASPQTGEFKATIYGFRYEGD